MTVEMVTDENKTGVQSSGDHGLRLNYREEKKEELKGQGTGKESGSF